MFRISPQYTTHILERNRVVFISDHSEYLLKGELYVQIISSINDSKHVSTLRDNFNGTDINLALTRLKEKALITSLASSNDSYFDAFWHDMGLAAIDEDVSHQINLINLGKFDTTDFRQALTSLKISINEYGKFLVVVTDNYINTELQKINSQRQSSNEPWMIIKPTGRVLWIGPIFEPRKPGCWECLAQRIKENRRVEVDLFGNDNSRLNRQPQISLQTTRSIAFNIAATEIAKWLRLQRPHKLEGNIFTFDSGTLESTLHNCPQMKCATCQRTCVPDSKHTVLQSSKKLNLNDEGERSQSADTTLDRISTLISPITGIVPSLRHATVNGYNICYSITNFTNFNQISPGRFRIPEVAVGKGQTKASAIVGCICEAIERYNGTYTNQPQLRCRFSEIDQNAIHPHELLKFSERQYNDRKQLNAKNGPFNRISEPYDNSEIGWTRAQSLTDNSCTYLPSSFCYLSYPISNEVSMCPGDSNGCASGNSLEEALYYGLLEVIERDAVAIWWYNRIKRPLLKVDPYLLKGFHDAIQEQDRHFFLLDITTDLLIPCFVAVSCKKDGSRVFFGSAAHLNPRLAISRAIGELSQLMIRQFLPQSTDLEKIPPQERELAQWILTQSIYDHPHLLPLDNQTKQYPAIQSSLATDDFLDDIQTCIKLLTHQNVRAFFVNLNNSSINHHTVKVICPELRHFWCRLAPGRLYDVPLKMKWISKNLLENEMNDVPYFL